MLLICIRTDDAPAPVSDYMDASEIKVKKPKKKKTKSTRRRDDDDVLYPGETETPETDQQMEIDSGPSYTKKRKTFDEDFVDDDDLQQSLARQRSAALKKRKTRPEELAKQLREQSNQPEPEASEAGGIVIDEISEFVDALHAEREEEKKAPKPKPQPRGETAVTAMEEESSDEEMEDVDKDGQQSERATSPTGELPTTGVEEEKLVAQGMAATFALLKDRRLIDAESRGSELVNNFRESAHFKAELARLMKKFDDETRLQRERDRASGRLDRMSTREREEWQRQQNTIREQHQARVMEQLFREAYKPTVELKYVDADGRSLDQKEAFKELSHQFHGKGSGKGKTDKRLKKLEAERRRMAQSMLDASQNVGMSTAASHQGKKRKEAGVRLA